MKKYTEQEDQRPDPKPRKRPHVWQAYLQWNELVELRKRHLLRISSIEAGKSNLNSELEYAYLETLNIDKLIANTKKTMTNFGEASAPQVWQWMTSIKGLGEGGLAAQLIAQIDDIEKFSNISKLWRFAGLAVFDGKAEKNQPGEKAHKNGRLRSVCYLISEQFIKQQTPMYSDIYYQEKARLRELHPEKVGKDYTDGHIHNMAMRKTVKIFLQHLWIIWRETEGLPITMPYAIDILKHADYIEPFPP